VQLVAGDGDNIMATEAPALGVPGGVKVDLPAPKAPEPEAIRPAPAPPAPEPVKMTPAPVPPAPEPAKNAPEKTAPKTPSLATQIRKQIVRAESRAKQQVKKEQAAAAKRAAAEAKRAAEEEKARTLTKAEFDAQNKTKAATPAKSASTRKVAKIDVEGIVSGVKGGASKEPGARGKALTSDNADAMAAYAAYFSDRMREKFVLPPDTSDALQVEVQFLNHADGRISNPGIRKSSGNRVFDEAVLDALRKVVLGPRPDKKTETVTFIFNLRDADGG
jgi:colicin import membrane protein